MPDLSNKISQILAATYREYHNRLFGKSLLSGGTAALIDLLLLYFFTAILHWPSWTAVNSAFAGAVLVNFSLQKFWVFSERASNSIHQQLIKFYLIALVNFITNAVLMYIMINILNIWYLMAQVLVTGLLAMFNFMAYKLFIFRHNSAS